MRDRFLALFRIESGEEYIGLLLLTQSVFLGIFFGAFDISAHSLFLAIFDEKMMAKGYVVSGIAGIILSSLYNWFQTRMQLRTLSIINLFVVTSLTLILWVAITLTPAYWVIFMVFIMLGPLNILALLGIWGTTDRLLSLRKGKKLSGPADAGLIIGIIIICYTIPVLLSFKFQVHNFLLIGGFSVLIAAIIQIMIGAGFRLTAARGVRQPEKPEEKRSFMTVFHEDPYTRIIALFIALSVVTAFFIQYSFMAVTREQYPAEEDLARFLGIFTGSMMIFTLLVKYFVAPFIIKNYRLRTSLIITPALVAAFTILAVAAGIFIGYTPESASGLLLFFLLLALSRLFSKSLKDSLESPSLKVIYQTIDEKFRYGVKSGINSTINEIAAVSSGLILTVLGVLGFIKLIHFSWILFFIILLWVLVAFRLYTVYRKSIREALETARKERSDTGILTENSFYKNRFAADSTFRSDYFNLISGDYHVFENNHNKWYLKKIIDNAASNKDINLLPVLKKIALNTGHDEAIRQRSTEIIEILEMISSSAQVKDEKIGNAAKILAGTRLPQTTEILRLLRGNAIESKKLAIYMIGKFKLSDMLPDVCECLNIPGLERDASAVIRSFGSDAVAELLRFYYISSGNINTCKTILHLLGKTRSGEGIGFLFSRLWSNSRQLKEVASENLIACEFKPSEEEKDRLLQLISEVVGLMTWNLAAKVCLEKNNDSFLLEAFKKEFNRCNRFLFNLLSITYNPGSINKIRENLENETFESLRYALEMVDIVIDDSIKPKLIPLLNVVPDVEKLKNLNQFFPVEVPQYTKLPEDIINRDYNLLSIWTKACALRNLPEFEDDDMAESVVALLFSPEEILQEESAKLIARSSRELYRSASQRIPVLTKERLDKIVDRATDGEELVFEKVKFLSDCFEGIPEEELLSLAGCMRFIKDSQSGFPSFPEGSVMWPLTGDNKGKKGDVNFNDQVKSRGEEYGSSDKAPCYILPLSAIEEYNCLNPERSSEIFKYIDSIEEDAGQ